MKHQEKRLPLSKLIINTNNDRFEPVENEIEAIDRMLEAQGDKIYQLAKHIVEFDLSPKPFYVITYNNKYVVGDGNRRTTALKLMKNPKLISNTKFANLKKRFTNLQKQFINNPINSVNCCIFDNYDEIDKWIKLEHTGEQKGVGIVPWNSEQIQRFNERKGLTKKVERQAIDFLRASYFVSDEIKELANDMSLTNFARFINDKYVREKLGLEVANNKLFSYYDEETLSNILSSIVKRFSDKSFVVGEIYDTKKRKNYLEHFKDIIPSDDKRTTNPWEVENPLDTNKKIEQERAIEEERKLKNFKQKVINTKRSSIIPKSCNITISNPKVNKIYDELKSLDIYKFVNCGAVTLRVFIELSVDTFLERKQLLKDGDISAAKSGYALFNKISRVCDYLMKHKIIDDAIAKPIKIMTKEYNSIFSIDTMHSYVHNNRVSPIADNILISWDNIQDFMIILWQEIEKE